MSAQPALHLRLRMRMRGHRLDLVQRHRLTGSEHERDRHNLLGDDRDRVGRGEHVERAGDAAFNRVLDGCHEGVEVTGDEVGGRSGDRGDRHELQLLRRRARARALSSLERLQQRLVREGGLGTQESVPRHERQGNWVATSCAGRVHTSTRRW